MKVTDKVVPYDTGKVKIGLLYQPKSNYIADYDASVIQGAILKRYKERTWYSASNVTTGAINTAVVFLWVFVLIATVVRW